MEQEIILHGTPESTQDINYWNVDRVHVTENRHGLAYQIRTGGSMSQDFTAVGTLTKYQLRIEYDLLDRSTNFGTKVLFDLKGKTRSQKVYVPLIETTNKTLNTEVIDGNLNIDEDFEYLSVSIENVTSNDLLIYSINCIAALEQEDGMSVNAQEFAKYCISYGTDANKPKLR